MSVPAHFPGNVANIRSYTDLSIGIKPAYGLAVGRGWAFFLSGLTSFKIAMASSTSCGSTKGTGFAGAGAGAGVLAALKPASAGFLASCTRSADRCMDFLRYSLKIASSFQRWVYVPFFRGAWSNVSSFATAFFFSSGVSFLSKNDLIESVVLDRTVFFYCFIFAHRITPVLLFRAGHGWELLFTSKAAIASITS